MRECKNIDRKHPFSKVLIVFFVLTVFSLSGNQINQSAVAQNSQERRFRVTLDPGHGGKDAGESGQRSVEKDITLKIAERLGFYLTSLMENVDVSFTRTTDVFVPLNQRTRLAAGNQSDLFISIHLGADNDNTVAGTTTFVLGSFRSTQGTLPVIQENKSILLEPDYKTRYPGMDPLNPGSYSDGKLIKADLIKQSTELAETIQSRLRSRANRKDLGIRQGNFIVLWDCPMPSVLIKAGYLTNPDEEEFLMSENGQDMIASALFMAIQDYRKSSANQTNVPTPEVKPDVKITKPDAPAVKLPADKKTDVKNTDVKKTDPVIPQVKKETAPTTQQKGISTVYAIQVAATRSFEAPVDFREKYNLPDSVYWFTRDNWYKYVTGRFNSHEEAEKYKAQHKISGFVTTVPEK
jgi:N-acetylmuramoyl-L-alanine amidase